MRERDDVGPLRGGEAAAIGADEYFERVLALADRDRVALAHIVRVIVHDLPVGVAARERRGEREHRGETRYPRGEPVAHAGRELGHEIVLLVSSGQSRMKP